MSCTIPQIAPRLDQAKEIVGRGIAGKGGKTPGRGTKGQKARRQIPAGFEGGQLPLLSRIPFSKGFTNPFRVAYTPVNLDALAQLGLSEITPEVLIEKGPHARRTSSRCSDVASSPRRSTSQLTVFRIGQGRDRGAPGARWTVLDLPFAVRPPRRVTNTRTVRVVKC